MTSASSPVRPPIIPEGTSQTISGLRQKIGIRDDYGQESAAISLRERITAAVIACFTAQAPAASPLEVNAKKIEVNAKKIHAMLRQADATTFRIYLYAKFQSVFRPLLKLFNTTPSIASLNLQHMALKEAQTQATSFTNKLTDNDQTFTRLNEANEQLMNSLDSAVAEIEKALIEAYKDEFSSIESKLKKLTEHYEAANEKAWLTTAQFQEELSALATEFQSMQVPSDMSETTNSAISALRSSLEAKLQNNQPAISQAAVAKRIANIEKIFKPLLPAGFNFTHVDSAKLDAIVAARRQSKATHLSLAHQLQFLEILKAQTTVVSQLEKAILKDTQTTLSAWQKAEDSMFSGKEIFRGKWVSEAAYRAREVPLESALTKLQNTGTSAARAKATQQLAQLKRHQTDASYQQKKAELNFNLLTPLLEKATVLAPATEIENASVADCLKWAMRQSDLNDRLEAIILRHLPEGANELQGALNPGDLTDIIIVLEEAKETAKQLVDANILMTGLQPLNYEFAQAIAQIEAPRDALVAKSFATLQKILGPHHKLPLQLEAAVKRVLMDPEGFKIFSRILEICEAKYNAIPSWVDTRTEAPFEYDEIGFDRLLDYIAATNPSLVKQIVNLQNILFPKIGKLVNSQHATDPMLLAMFSKEELSNSTETRYLDIVDRYENKNYFEGEKYLHISDYNVWGKSEWRAKLDAQPNGKALTSYDFEWHVATPSGDNQMRYLAKKATLNFASLGALTHDEQRAALVFARMWCDSLHAPKSHEEALAAKDPSLIPDNPLSPSGLPLLSLRRLLLDDANYWTLIDDKEKQAKLTSTDRQQFESQNRQVIERYGKLIAACKKFKADYEKAFLRGLMGIGTEESQLVDIKPKA